MVRLRARQGLGWLWVLVCVRAKKEARPPALGDGRPAMQDHPSPPSSATEAPGRPAEEAVAAPGRGGAFTLKSHDDIVDELSLMAEMYPDLVEVYTAQDRYGLPSPGGCGSKPCVHHVLHITELATLPLDPGRPEVFFSGCLHGNERVGPTATMEAAWLLLKAYSCQNDPSKATDCAYGSLLSDPDHVPWLAGLLATRNVYIMPMTNSWGYYHDTREEVNIDPNRDFPFNQAPDKCMTSVVARAVNELFREHAFQLALTFHAGMVAIAYEWGSTNHPKKRQGDVSPDEEVQASIGKSLSLFGGSFTDAEGTAFPEYPSDRMNQIVYPVDGGMEDWAYASSWDGHQPACEPSTFGGYPKARTRYTPDMLRTLNILVEAAENKTPMEDTLGSIVDVFNPNPAGDSNGHIPRNIRLVLTTTDIVQPYLVFVDEEEDASQSPSQRRQQQQVSWRVGGCTFVNSTRLAVMPLSADSETPWSWEKKQKGGGAGEGVAAQASTWPILSQRLAAKAGDTVVYSNAQTGPGRWGVEDGAAGTKTLGPVYTVRFSDMDPLADGDYAVAVTARVDLTWASDPEHVHHPELGPQSHFVNARTNPSWDKSVDGHTVQGKVNWWSPARHLRVSKGKGRWIPHSPPPIPSLSGSPEGGGEGGEGEGQKGKGEGQKGEGEGQEGKGVGQKGEGEGQKGKGEGQKGEGEGQKGKGEGQKDKGEGQEGKGGHSGVATAGGGEGGDEEGGEEGGEEWEPAEDKTPPSTTVSHVAIGIMALCVVMGAAYVVVKRRSRPSYLAVESAEDYGGEGSGTELPPLSRLNEEDSLREEMGYG